MDSGNAKEKRKRSRTEDQSSPDSHHTESPGKKVRQRKEHKKEKKKDKGSKRDKRILVKEAKKYLNTAKEEDLLPATTEIVEIGTDDFFRKCAEFAVWLQMEHGIFFNDLLTAESKEYFESFCRAWNSRKLPARLYAGIIPSSAPRSKHQWGLKASS